MDTRKSGQGLVGAVLIVKLRTRTVGSQRPSLRTIITLDLRVLKINQETKLEQMSKQGDKKDRFQAGDQTGTVEAGLTD